MFFGVKSMGLFDKIIKKEETKETKKELGTRKKRDVRREIDVVPLEEDVIAKTIVEPEIRYVKKVVVTSYTDLEKISEEIQAGNQEFKDAMEDIENRLNKIELPEVDYFRKYFLPAVHLTVDQLYEPE